MYAQSIDNDGPSFSNNMDNSLKPPVIHGTQEIVPDQRLDESTRLGGIEEDLKHKGKLDDADIKEVLLNLVSRKRFIYGVKDLIEYIFKCLCLRRNLKNLKKQ